VRRLTARLMVAFAQPRSGTAAKPATIIPLFRCGIQLFSRFGTAALASEMHGIQATWISVTACSEMKLWCCN
jgi:hypothetical protein